MVTFQIEARGVRNAKVLEAMMEVPRHRFVDPSLAWQAYDDHPLPIGRGQTISQPYIVAFMAEALGLRGDEKVLEVGSGCGYMTAVLARLAREVFGVELEPSLHALSREILADLEVSNATVVCGDGRLGWADQAPFDAIVISCAAQAVPPALWEQLAPGGRILLPLEVNPVHQELVLVTRTPQGPVSRELLAVVFVPLR